MSKFFALVAGNGSFWQNLAERYQGSLIHELLSYLEEKYFTVSLGEYQNFSVGNTAGTTLRNVVVGLALGIIIASAMMAHTKQGVGRFVRTLIRNGCTDAEHAKTLLELGYFQNPSIRRELKRKVTLGKLVRCVEEDAFYQSSSTEETAHNQSDNKPFWRRLIEKNGAFEIDFRTMRFYVPEELRYRAEIRFENRGSGWIAFILVTVLSVIAAGAVCFLLPDVLQLVDNMIGMIAG